MLSQSIGQARVRYDTIHIVSVLAYAMICGLGSLCPPIGVAFIALFALVGTFIAIIRNIQILMLVLFIGGLSVAIPPIGIVAFLIMVYLFIRRVGFLIHHWKLILLGIVAYSMAMGVMYLGSLFNGNVLAICAMGVIGGLIFHSVLHWANTNGYSAEKAIEIMSIIPLLLISIILPFLKLHFGADHLNPDMNVAHGIDTPVAPSAVMDTVALNSAMLQHHNIDPTPIVLDGSHFQPVSSAAFGSDGVIETMQPHHFTGIENIGSSSGAIHPVFDHILGRSSVIDNQLGQLTARIIHNGNTDILQNQAGQNIGRLVHQGDTTIVQNSMTQTVGLIIHHGNMDTLQDMNGMMVGKITHTGNADVIQAPSGLQMGRIVHNGDLDVVQNVNGQALYTIHHQDK